ncbi:MAG: TonB-dependent receptor [Proteobacteria bacterium]|nr:TonB-dependent receptor [Pseudomonadota bacterium]
MARSRSLQQAVRFALATASAAAGVTALHAQEAPAPAATAAPVEEVVVTGSRLLTPNETSISPVTSVTATDIAATGLTRTEDILNNLPMVFAGQNSTTSNGSDGTATIDLRGLGNQRTLVLVNGRRLGPGQGDGRNYSDINQIPAALIDRIDIETGGASATYGADAVAGVVNFVLNTHFEGVKVDAGYHFNEHSNNATWAQQLVTAAGDQNPDSRVDTGFGKNFSVVMGSNFADDKGNATAYVTYDNQGATTQNKYDYSACTFGKASATALQCAGSYTSKGGLFLAYGNNGSDLLYHTVDPKTGQFRYFNPATDLYNYGPLNYYQTPNERWTAGAFVNYEVNSHVTAYSEFMWTRNESSAQIAESGDFGVASFIPCANPLLTAQERSTLCSAANLAAQGNPTETVGGVTYPGINTYILRRNVEGGPRTATFRSDAVRLVLGLKGDFADAWHWDVYAQRGTVDTQLGNENYLNNTSIANALNVVPGANGPTCASVIQGTDKACVPWNIWVPGGVTKAATSYLSVPLLVDATVAEQVVSGSITGDLGKYGVKLPTADSGLQVNFGAEYRSEAADFLPDYLSQQGSAAGSGGPTNPVSGDFHVKEAFTEFGLPLVEHAPLVESLSLNGGYRYSDYSEGFKTNTYKIGMEYAPLKDIKLRASYQRAVRAPNIAELYAPQSVQLDGSIDPCAGAAPAASAAKCALTGVSAAQYGHIGANAANQYNGLLGGNPQLEPEKADTYSIGLVFTPTFVSGLTASVDYFNIKIDNIIGRIGADTIINNCLASNDANSSFCQAIHRSPTGSLWLTPAGYVSDTNVNQGQLSTKGLDITAAYRVPLPKLGSVTLGLEGTRLNSLATEPISGGPSYDCVGYFGSICGAANPKWRSVFTATWATPWDGLDFGLRWRYIGADDSELTSSNPQLAGAPFVPTSHIGAYNYIDLQTTFNLAKNVTLQLGVNNIADKNPPIVVGGDCSTSSPAGANCNGNTFPGVYDAMGRYLFAHISAQF